MITVAKDYIELTKKLPLVSIRNDDHLREANALLATLSGKDMTAGKRDYFRVLSKLVGEYEDARFSIEHMTPVEAFAYIMEESGLTRAQMGDIIGCRPNRISEILAGSRELSKEHIARLSAHFKVSANLFLPMAWKNVS